MADLPPAHGSSDDTGVGPGRGSTRRRPRWVMVFGIILVKLGVIALILVLPFGLAISLGAAHGVAMLVLLVVAAVTLLVYKLRGRTLPPALSHRPPRGHRFVLGRLARHGRGATTSGSRRVKVFGIIVLVLVHLLVILYFTGVLGGH